MKATYDQVRAYFLSLPRTKVWDLVAKLDGHSIFKPESFDMPAEIVEFFTHRLQSTDKFKGQLYIDNKPVKYLVGIYGLSMLKTVADMVGVQYEEKLGRGSQASVILVAIYNWQKQAA